MSNFFFELLYIPKMRERLAAIVNKRFLFECWKRFVFSFCFVLHFHAKSGFKNYVTSVVIQSEVKPNPSVTWLARTLFPARQRHVYSSSLIGSLHYCVIWDWLARLYTSVLVLRLSFENLSIRRFEWFLLNFVLIIIEIPLAGLASQVVDCFLAGDPIMQLILWLQGNLTNSTELYRRPSFKINLPCVIQQQRPYVKFDRLRVDSWTEDVFS